MVQNIGITQKYEKYEPFYRNKVDFMVFMSCFVDFESFFLVGINKNWFIQPEKNKKQQNDEFKVLRLFFRSCLIIFPGGNQPPLL